MGKKKTFIGSSKEDAEQKAEAWLVSQKGIKVLSKKISQLATTPSGRFAPKKQEWETVIEYE
jgi:hypothetical protein